MQCEKQNKLFAVVKMFIDQFKSAKTIVGSGYRSRTVIGVDVNELNKLYTILIAKNDLQYLNRYLDKLINSQFCRTGQTQGYYRNIQTVLRKSGFFQMDIDDAKFVLGWVCKLMRYYKNK